VPRDYLDILYEINHQSDPRMYPPKQPGAAAPRPIGSKMDSKIKGIVEPPKPARPAAPPRPGVPGAPVAAAVAVAAEQVIVSTPTLKRYGNKVPGTLQVNQFIQPAPDQPKQEDLPNLMDNIAKKRFKKAVHAVLVARAMSSIVSQGSGSGPIERTGSVTSLNSNASGELSTSPNQHESSPTQYGQYLAPSNTNGSLPLPSDETLTRAADALQDHFAAREITRSETLNTEVGDYVAADEIAHTAQQLTDLNLRTSHSPRP